MDKIQKCTLKRVAWIMLMAIITVTGVILVNEYKLVYTGIAFILIGIGLFLYKMKTWKRYID